MDYHRIYFNIIERAKNRVIDGYIEKHHVIPKCLGGSNDAENIACLTAEEHFLCHELLVKMHPGVKKLVFALRYMSCPKSSTGSRIKRAKEFGWIKRLNSEARKGPRPPEVGIAISRAKRGKPQPYAPGRVSGAKGKHHSPEVRARISASVSKAKMGVKQGQRKKSR